MSDEGIFDTPRFKASRAIARLLNSVVNEEIHGSDKSARGISMATNPVIVELIKSLPPEEAAAIINAAIHDAMQTICRVGFA